VAQVTIQAEVEGLRRELNRACELAEKMMLRRSYYSAGYMEGRREKLKLEEIEKDKRQKLRDTEGMTEAERVEYVHKIGKALSEAQICPEGVSR